MRSVRLLAVVIGLAFSLSFCDGASPEPLPPAEPDTTEVLEDSPEEPASDADSDSDVVIVEPAQEESCVPSMTVNGESAVVGGRYIEFEKGTLPDLEVAVLDCPHEKEEARADAAGKINFGGARTGFGSGEVHIVVTKRGGLPREFSRLGSERVTIDAEIVGEFAVVDGELVSDSGAWRSEGDQGEDSSALFKGITAPSRRSTPTSRVDTPVAIAIDVDVSSRASSGEDIYPVQIQLRFFSAAGHDKNTSLTLREACSAEAQASPSRFDC